MGCIPIATIKCVKINLYNLLLPVLKICPVVYKINGQKVLDWIGLAPLADEIKESHAESYTYIFTKTLSVCMCVPPLPGILGSSGDFWGPRGEFWGLRGEFWSTWGDLWSILGDF